MTQEVTITTPAGVEIVAPVLLGYERVLTSEALSFVADLHRRFNPTRLALLAERDTRQADIERGHMPGFLEETRAIREDASWRVAPPPADLLNRRVEITGPVERKMMINALNSGAWVFMADLEDSLSPTWANVVEGQVNLMDAVRRTLTFTNPDGREYRLNDQLATLIVRPRGWHLTDKHLLVDGEPVSASLLDFGLYVFHNAQALLDAGSGPYYYLAKLEGHREARLWNDVLNAAEDALGLTRGTVKATVLIETILAAFEMDEILYELREHMLGFNAGRWDYIFSAIKKFRSRPGVVFPDRAQVTMTVPFMRAYTELLVQTCHKRGAHAIGGMAAFIPSRKDAEVNAVAMAKVREDKQREANDGFDGTWVAHPDLVPVAFEVFDAKLGDRPNQKERLRDEVRVEASQLIDFVVPGGSVTEAGIRNNISVALQYIATWLSGNGAVAIFNLMEDAATAEIARAQLWQWLHQSVSVDGMGAFTPERYAELRDAEVEKLAHYDAARLQQAVTLLDDLVLPETFTDFLTLPGYELL